MWLESLKQIKPSAAPGLFIPYLMFCAVSSLDRKHQIGARLQTESCLEFLGNERHKTGAGFFLEHSYDSPYVPIKTGVCACVTRLNLFFFFFFKRGKKKKGKATNQWHHENNLGSAASPQDRLLNIQCMIKCPKQR